MKRRTNLLKAKKNIIEKEIAIPEILTCLWFKKHKEKIVEGQIINQNSVQILPSKQRLIPSLQAEQQLKFKQEQVQLQTLLDLPDTATKELDNFENFIQQFPCDPKYGRDVVLIEKILIVVNGKKDSIQNQLIQYCFLNQELLRLKLMTSLSWKTSQELQITYNYTSVQFKSVSLVYLLNNLVIVLRSHYKEEMKVFILSGLITLIDNEVYLPELILFLGIKNKTQKFSLQINKNQRLQEYIITQMQLNQVEITDQVESKLLIKKIKIQDGENIPIIHSRDQVSEPQLIIRALRLLSNSDMTKQLSEIWQKPSIVSLKNQVYKNCLKKNKNDTTIGKIKNLFYKIDNKYEIFNDNQQ
ncbi:unnamed protein product [Paramecium octaurelia]|uniref:Uncharacterized protein n=1 Tax=Paramecium octaurelia TaxID=43137 RepID=A0A8S1S3U2_PAROT|nr:unnamed protein product [Paramecium octaurelia]